MECPDKIGDPAPFYFPSLNKPAPWVKRWAKRIKSCAQRALTFLSGSLTKAKASLEKAFKAKPVANPLPLLEKGKAQHAQNSAQLSAYLTFLKEDSYEQEDKKEPTNEQLREQEEKILSQREKILSVKTNETIELCDKILIEMEDLLLELKKQEITDGELSSLTSALQTAKGYKNLLQQTWEEGFKKEKSDSLRETYDNALLFKDFFENFADSYENWKDQIDKFQKRYEGFQATSKELKNPNWHKEEWEKVQLVPIEKQKALLAAQKELEKEEDLENSDTNFLRSRLQAYRKYYEQLADFTHNWMENTALEEKFKQRFPAQFGRYHVDLFLLKGEIESFEKFIQLKEKAINPEQKKLKIIREELANMCKQSVVDSDSQKSWTNRLIADINRWIKVL